MRTKDDLEAAHILTSFVKAETLSVQATVAQTEANGSIGSNQQTCLPSLAVSIVLASGTFISGTFLPDLHQPQQSPFSVPYLPHSSCSSSSSSSSSLAGISAAVPTVSSTILDLAFAHYLQGYVISERIPLTLSPNHFERRAASDG